MRKFLVFAAVLSLLGSGQTLAQNAYITNEFSNSVSVIETATNTVIATIPAGSFPEGVAVTPDGSKVYVANNTSDTVSVIATASNKVIATIPVGIGPTGVAVTQDGSEVYVANYNSNAVSVIATAKIR
jgi:YVTN family beta-propeller protein